MTINYNDDSRRLRPARVRSAIMGAAELYAAGMSVDHDAKREFIATIGRLADALLQVAHSADEPHTAQRLVREEYERLLASAAGDEEVH